MSNLIFYNVVCIQSSWLRLANHWWDQTMAISCSMWSVHLYCISCKTLVSVHILVGLNYFLSIGSDFSPIWPFLYQFLVMLVFLFYLFETGSFFLPYPVKLATVSPHLEAQVLLDPIFLGHLKPCLFDLADFQTWIWSTPLDASNISFNPVILS